MLAFRGLNKGNSILVFDRMNLSCNLKLGLNNALGNGLPLAFDIPKNYGVTKIPTIEESDYQVDLLESGNPLIIYQTVQDGTILTDNGFGLFYLGKKGKMSRRGFQLNVQALGFEAVNYKELIGPKVLQDPQVKYLRNLVDTKIFSRLRRAA